MTYPVMLSLKGRECLVAGAGAVAERKTRRLVAEGAAVTVVSPGAAAYFSNNRRIKFVKRKFRAADLDGKFLVIAATGEEKTNDAICRLAGKKNMLANSARGRKNANFMNMAYASKKGLVAAVSSGGRDVRKSIKTAGEIRKKIL